MRLITFNESNYLDVRSDWNSHAFTLFCFEWEYWKDKWGNITFSIQLSLLGINLYLNRY